MDEKQRYVQDLPGGHNLVLLARPPQVWAESAQKILRNGGQTSLPSMATTIRVIHMKHMYFTSFVVA